MFSLTPQEERVLMLIGQGAGDLGIAEDLDIKVKTVEWYISQIKFKLGQPGWTRDELAQWAARLHQRSQ